MLRAVALDQFASEIGGLKTPNHVLDALHALVRSLVNVYAAWRMPIYRSGMELYVSGENVWFHSSVSQAFIKDFWPLMRQNGKSPLALLAHQSRKLITWSEGMRKLALTGDEAWLFDLARRHRMRDGAYCSFGAWMVGYWSSKPIRQLSAADRACLCMAAGFAVHRLEEMINAHKIDGKVPALTARQASALRLLAHGDNYAEIAARMGIGEDTVGEHLEAARRKLGARNRHHAACQALRLHLIA